MSQPANPDPTGVFSKTEFDLAAAKGLNAPQPKPTALPGNPDQADCFSTVSGLVIADIWDFDNEMSSAPHTMGSVKHRNRRLPNDGCDALISAYQKSVELCIYMRALILKRDGR
jgi:hypothetical protein